MIELSAGEWEFIFKGLDMARNMFANNPVLQDVMNEEEREHFIVDISGIMDKIGLNGNQAFIKGSAPNVISVKHVEPE